MVYSNRFVMCVLVNNEVQTELANGVVPIPFNQEYALRFRNKNERRCVVKFFLDGENVSGNGYVINKNSHVDILRHQDKDAAFKFVELNTPEAHDAGKNGPNFDGIKGVIEARFYLEKENRQPIVLRPYEMGYRSIRRSKTWIRTGPDDIASFGRKEIPIVEPRVTLSDDSSRSFSSKELKDGCTVEGSHTGQKFTSVSIDLEEDYTVLKLFLQGYEKPISEEVPEVIVVNDKQKSKLKQLEEENNLLREKLAELENQKLKQKIADLSASANS